MYVIVETEVSVALREQLRAEQNYHVQMTKATQQCDIPTIDGTTEVK